MPRVSRRLLAVLLAGTVVTLIGLAPGSALAAGTSSPPANTNPPNSPSSNTVETYIRTWLNRDRSARGLRPMRVDLTLRAVATTRAGTLASLGLLSHSAPGNLSSQLNATGIRWYGWGEDIGWSSYSWGYAVASSLYSMWKHSPEHWTLMMSSHYNYLGVGLGYRWPDGATYASIVFAELPDETAPSARLTAAGRRGTSVWFHYTATDPLLQTHTSGLRDYDLEYRVDGGAWTVIRVHRTAVSITLSSRAPGHTYYLSVRARDRAGNVSGWSKPMHVTVP
jgi:uncharacterized protein YkwD